MQLNGAELHLYKRAPAELNATEREIEKIAVRAIRENRYCRAVSINRSGDIKEETVHVDKLYEYIDSALKRKRGCALLIDSVCLYQGENVKQELIEKWCIKMTDRWVPPLHETSTVKK